MEVDHLLQEKAELIKRLEFMNVRSVGRERIEKRIIEIEELLHPYTTSKGNKVV